MSYIPKPLGIAAWMAAAALLTLCAVPRPLLSPTASAPADTVADAADAAFGGHRAQETYGSTPKGITLEGAATGLPPVHQVQFVSGAGPQQPAHLVLNGVARYALPIPAAEFGEIVDALAHDHRIGVTLLTNRDFFTYGRLDKRGRVAQALAAADRILGGIILATPGYLDGVRLPQNFRPAVVRGRRSIWSAARLNYTGYAFGLHPETGTYRRIHYQVEPFLTPVLPGQARDGGHLRDDARIRQGILGEKEDVDNFNFFRTHLNDFMQITELARVVHLGEAASLVRYLRAQGVDLQELAGQLRR